MPWNLGIFSRAYPSWTNDANSNLPISATKFDAEDNDFAAGFNTLVGNLQQNAHFKAGSVAGTNTVTGSLTPALTGYLAGMYVVLTPVNTNTGATTLNLNGLGSLAVQNIDGTACVGGELVTGIPALLLLNSGATAWIIQAPANSKLTPFTTGIVGNRTIAQTDQGRVLLYQGAGGHTFTFPNSGMTPGSIFEVTHLGGTSITLAHANFLWLNGSGASTSLGNRTMVLNGNAVIQYVDSGANPTIKGTGLS